MAEVDQSSYEWLYEYLLQFLRSPGWKVPIMSFVDENCIVFDDEEENKLSYTEVHNQFREMIDNLMGNLCGELGISEELMAKIINMGLKNSRDRRVFEQIIACDNFMSFKKLMVKRNKELEAEALEMMGTEVPQSELQEANEQARNAEIEHAIALSMAQEEERLRLEEEEKKQIELALKLSEEEFRKAEELRKQEAEQIEQLKQKPAPVYEAPPEVEPQIDSQVEQETRNKLQEEQKQYPKLPPVRNFKKTDVSEEMKQAENLQKRAEEIAKQNTSEPEPQKVSTESLAERQARLRAQRDALLARKKQERQKELQEYVEQGGSDFSKPEQVPQEELEKRRQIAAKLKASS
mmetsp:Transcript_10431/g.15600  ORF Transcript_10431/g.15600 Transcript_10431/m.15600 type:complete len:350 (-) Transcript_10431:310-1359(-)|eukprot:CAMPEP_0202435032 /NCGR_PEP_ID=MMETSP1345-20130828/17339_1 /ASSEMBLY_ACC=CAM_ASM_000843 /TAXON_ID=342563 /ORGANISM="Fabrea Fabrea salina" /LENGTH=349 /DNA_ID=CAMNT_0049047921 /DNA_START=1066 /DNA_END=2115 /DNA_ORIENTATION=+